MANVVRAAPVQATWTGDTESMVAKHEEHAREAARRGATVIGKGGGHNTTSLRIAPPLPLTVAEAEEGTAILERALRSL